VPEETTSQLALESVSIISVPESRNVYERDELALRSIRIIEILNPFRPGECETREVSALDNESLGAVVARADRDVERFDASINGERIAAEDVWRTVVHPGDEVVLFPCAGHGGLKSIGMMMMALTVGLVSWGIGLYVGISFLGMSYTAASILGSAIGMAGNMLISWALSAGQPSAPAWSLTYDPTGPKGLAQPGTPVPKAYGAMGWCGNIISSFVDFDGSKAYIYALACYGFGKATSITDIKLNSKSISDYQNTTYQVRYGTNDQTPIDGFNRTVNGYPQETELKVSNGAVTVVGTGTEIQGLQITIKFPDGLYRITNDGNYVPLKCIYTIQIAEHGSSTWTEPLFPYTTKSIATTHSDGSETWPTWVVVPTDRFAGSGLVYAYNNDSHTAGDAWSSTMDVKTVAIDGSTSTTSSTFQGSWQLCDSAQEQVEVTAWQQGYRVINSFSLSAFFDTVTIYGLSKAQWDVKVTKIGYAWDQGSAGDTVYADPTDAKHVCDIWLWNINEVEFSDLAYPNMILIGVQALATSQMSGSDLQIMATITHLLGEDTTLPTQLASYETDNPAIVAYDVLTNTLYGMSIAATNIDIPAFKAWADFCDETVTNQDGTTVRRFIFDGVFDQSSDAWKTLQTIGRMSRAAVVPIGTRYTVVIDGPADPVQLFTVGNTKRDSFRESWLSLDDRATLIECDFADAARNYRMDLPISVMTSEDLNSGINPKPTRTKLIGCTSRDQAWRWVYYQLLSTKLSLRTIQFEAAIESCCCRPGSVIAVQNDTTQWASGGRIQSGSTITTLNIDRNDLTFAASDGYAVSVQHPLVLRGTATVQTIASSTKTVSMTAALPSGRILKAVSADGTEYVVEGYGGSTLVLSTAPSFVAGTVLSLYDVNIIESLDVVSYTANDTGAVLGVAGDFAAVPTEDCAWAYGQSAGAQPAKLFRVTIMKRSGDFNYTISGLEYSATAYEDVTPNYGEVVGVPDSSPYITELTLSEQYGNSTATGSTTTSVIAVGWKNGNTAVGALIEMQANGGSWTTVGKTTGQSCTLTGTVGIEYTVRATGFDWDGNTLGTAVTATITVTASTNAPDDVTSFTGTQTSSGATLTWDAVTSADHYELRYSELTTLAWDTATVLSDTLTGTTFTETTIRTGTYMIVAVGPTTSGSLESTDYASLSMSPAPPVATITQSTTSSSSSTSGSSVNTTTSGTITVSTKVYLTITWTWSSSFRTPTGFQVVAFTGDDPTNTTNYLFDIVTVDASARSYTAAITPGSNITVNAAVRANYE
jgi:hypothetical protein